MTEPFISDCDCYLPPVQDFVPALPTEADIFGAGSRLAAGPAGGLRPEAAPSFPLTDNYPYEILTLFAFILFCYIFYNYRNSIVLLFSALVRKKISTEKPMEEKTQFFRQFSFFSALLGILTAGGMVVRTGEYFGAAKLVAPGMLARIAPWTAPAALAAILLIVLYKYLVIRTIGFLTENRAFFGAHSALSRFFSSAASLVVTPFFLLTALNEGPAAGPLIGISIGICTLLYLFYLIKSYHFFTERGVSILQWFLYLCTVEFFPVSFFILLIVRNA